MLSFFVRPHALVAFAFWFRFRWGSAIFSTFAYLVNLLLASRFLNIPKWVARYMSGDQPEQVEYQVE